MAGKKYVDQTPLIQHLINESIKELEIEEFFYETADRVMTLEAKVESLEEEIKQLKDKTYGEESEQTA